MIESQNQNVAAHVHRFESMVALSITLRLHLGCIRMQMQPARQSESAARPLSVYITVTLPHHGRGISERRMAHSHSRTHTLATLGTQEPLALAFAFGLS